MNASVVGEDALEVLHLCKWHPIISILADEQEQAQSPPSLPHAHPFIPGRVWRWQVRDINHRHNQAFMSPRGALCRFRLISSSLFPSRAVTHSNMDGSIPGHRERQTERRHNKLERLIGKEIRHPEWEHESSSVAV